MLMMKEIKITISCQWWTGQNDNWLPVMKWTMWYLVASDDWSIGQNNKSLPVMKRTTWLLVASDEQVKMITGC